MLSIKPYERKQYLFHLNGTNLSETFHHSKTHLFHFQILGFASCNKNKIKVTLEGILGADCPEGSSYYSPGTVSLYCVADFFTCCNTDTANTHTVFV